jgi:hypothetical protein
LRISGRATEVMVAAVATEEPQMAPKAALASTEAIARPPRKRPITAAGEPRTARADSPPWVAKLPIRMNSGITDRS